MNAISIRTLDVVFGEGAQRNHVVRGLDLDVAEGETVGIVGESGCGKSTLLRCLIGLESRWSGQIEVTGQVVARTRSRDELRRMQMVFQDPFGSLHPRHRLGRAISEPLLCMGGKVTNELVTNALTQVGLSADFANRFPHQLSGGQRQRVAIARALVLSPDILLLDEPTSALDVSVQAEILNLLADLKEQQGLTYVLVSHDLAVIGHMCDRVLFMNEGQFVEELSPSGITDGTATSDYARQLISASML